MKLTNKHNLPAPVVRALSFDNYSKGDAEFSVTELLDSPRIRALQWRHREEITQDVTDNFFSLLGRACHQILEWGAKHSNTATAEERLFLTIDVDGVPITVSGSMDLQQRAGEDLVDILDYKVTSVLSATSDKISWEQQLNLYKHLVIQTKGLRVGKLQIVVFLRDWRKSNAKRDRFYPQSPIIVIDVPVWRDKDAAQFLLDRVRLHMDAGEKVLAGAAPAPCTTEERWEDEPVFAVLKPGGKRASRVYDTEAEAQQHVAKAKGELVIERRGGAPRRCQGNWCRVAEFCEYGRQFLGQDIEDEEDF